MDLCSGSSLDDQQPSTKKTSNNTNATTVTILANSLEVYNCRGVATLPKGAHLLNVGQPLQVGGLAHRAPDNTLHGWPEPLLAPPLLGCVRNLRVNSQVKSSFRGMIVTYVAAIKVL